MRLVPTEMAHRFLLLTFWCNYLLVTALFGPPARALNPDRSISQYAHSSWRIQEGVFNGEPNVIAQTSDGYLWIGTREGLLRFDGVRFVAWTPEQGTLPSNEITALLGARDGSLWIGTRAGLSHWKDHQLTTISGIPGPVINLLEDRRGIVWAARNGSHDTVGPLCRVEGEHGRCFGAPQGIPVRDGATLAEDTQGNLWLGTQNLLLRWRNGSPVLYQPAGLRSNNSAGIEGLVAAPDGSLWVGIAVPGHGLGLQHFAHGVWRPFRSPQLDSSTLEVLSLWMDRNGALWVGTANQGLVRIYRGKVDRFDSNDGLSSNFVSFFYEDHEGTLWVATPEGIDSFHDLSVTTWSTRQGLTTDNVVGVAAAHDGTVWIGNDRGLDSIRNGLVASIRSGHGLPGDQVRSIFEDREHRLWVGIDNDLTLYAGGRFQRITTPEGKSLGPVDALAEDSAGNLWVESGPPDKLLCIRDFHVRQQFPAPATPFARALAAGAQGDLWMGLISGDLARFRHGRTEIFHFPHAPEARVRQLLLGADGSVLGATGAGVIAWRDGRTRTLTSRNGLPCNGINGMLWDLHNNLWLDTVCRLIEIDHAELQRWWSSPDISLHVHTLDALDGVQPGYAYYEPAARSSDGRLWFANGSVLQMVDPAHLIVNPVPPPVHIEELFADHRRYLPRQSLRLPSLTRDLEIDYTALSLVAPRRVQFRYRLDGRDKEWQEAGVRRQAFYTDLPPGAYQFHVIASNNSDLWNRTGASLSFYLAPAFYQTSWFRLLCLLLTVAVLWSLYLLHLRRVTGKIQDRAAARLEERERIARELHDTLLQGFHGLMLRFQSVLNAMPREEPAHRMLEGALDRADQVLLEGRQRVWDLRDAASDSDLSQQLADCGEELARDYPARFSAALVGTPRPLQPAVSDEIRCIGREALTNAFRHARAKHIELELAYHPEKIRLLIRDDGAGIDSALLRLGRSGHWGLSGMRERAQQIGAQLNIWSNTGAGTEIDLTVAAKTAYRNLREDAAKPLEYSHGQRD